MAYSLEEIKKAMAENLLCLKEKLKNCEYRIDKIDEKIQEHQKEREEEVIELNIIRDLIKKLE